MFLAHVIVHEARAVLPLLSWAIESVPDLHAVLRKRVQLFPQQDVCFGLVREDQPHLRLVSRIADNGSNNLMT